MKVGIITIHNLPNYGAMLQAYALCARLREMGFDAETIDYEQPELKAYFCFKWSFPPRVTNWLRIKRCKTFVETKQSKSPKRYGSAEAFSSDAQHYDALITGSDQVWFTGPVQYYDPLFFLDLPQSKARKISYAASVGGSESFGEFEPQVRNALNQLDHLSVRDEHSASLVRPLTQNEPAQVVDPTFLCDFKDLLRPTSPSPEPYLLLFGNIASKWNGLIITYAKKLGVTRIVSLQYMNDKATHRLGAPSPEDWINHFKHAAGVITTYFHGTAFAIKFEKPFISIPTPGRVQKVQRLLEIVDLESRFRADDADPVSAENGIDEPIDWERATSMLAERIRISEQFLRDALGEPNSNTAKA